MFWIPTTMQDLYCQSSYVLTLLHVFCIYLLIDEGKKLPPHENLKLCLNLNPRYNNLETHKLANLNFLEDRRNVHVLNFMYLKLRSPMYKDNRIINTRKYDAPMLKIPPYTKTKSQNAAWYRGVSEWNKLDPDTRAIETYQEFTLMQKNLMKCLLL